MELTLLAAALTGAGAVWVTNRLLRERIEVERPTDLLLGAAGVGLLIGRLAAMIASGTNPLLRPADVIVVRGGVSTTVASLTAIGAVGWAARRDVPRSVAQLVPAALAGLAGWHGGCSFRDSCLGTATSLPWAISAPGSAVGRHPVEIYAAIGFAVAAVIAVRLTGRGWIGAGWGLAAAGGIRLATEPLRLSITGGPVWTYAAGLVVGVLLMGLGQRKTATRPPGPSSMTT